MTPKSILRHVRYLTLPHKSTTKPQPPSGRLFIAGLFSVSSGVGQSSQNLLELARSTGHDPIAIDLSKIFDSTCTTSASRLLKATIRPSDTLILVLNPPEVRLALRRLGLWRWNQPKIIGYWAWELEVTPSDWHEISHHFDEIWVPSEFVKTAVQSITQKPVTVVPMYSEPPAWISPISIEPKNLSYLVCADGKSSFSRKNILTAVRGFLKAYPKPGQARLTLKVHDVGAASSIWSKVETICHEHDHIHLVTQLVPRRKYWEYIAQADIILSPHRSEGYGLVLMESMAAGRCVVATGWSGNMDYMNNENAVLLKYTMTEITNDDSVYSNTLGARWAEVSIEDIAEALAMLAENARLRQRLAANASSDILARCERQKFPIQPVTSHG